MKTGTIKIEQALDMVKAYDNERSAELKARTNRTICTYCGRTFEFVESLQFPRKIPYFCIDCAKHKRSL